MLQAKLEPGVPLIFPMRERYPRSDEHILRMMAEALAQDVMSNGYFVAEFEARLRDLLQARHCIAVSSATAGLVLSVRAVEASELICVPTFGFPATALAALWSSGRIRFLDADPATFNTSAAAFEAALSKGPIPACMITLAVAGNLHGLRQIYARAKSVNVPVVLDAASCLGLTSDPLTRFADIVVLSLSSKKALPICEGGIVLTNSDEYARRLRSLRTYGYRVQNGFEIDRLGLNARLSEVHAAMGLAMLAESDSVLRKRVEVASSLRAQMDTLPEVTLQQLAREQTAASEAVFKVPADFRERVLQHLRAMGIDAVPFYYPILPRHAALQSLVAAGEPECEQAIALSHECVGIKTFSSWTHEHVTFVTTMLQEALQLAHQDRKAHG